MKWNTQHSPRPLSNSPAMLGRFVQNLCHELLGFPVPVILAQDSRGFGLHQVEATLGPEEERFPLNETWMNVSIEGQDSRCASGQVVVRVGSQLGLHFPKVWETLQASLTLDSLFRGIPDKEELGAWTFTFGSPMVCEDSPFSEQQAHWPDEFWEAPFESLHLWISGPQCPTTLLGIGMSGCGLLLLDSVRGLS